MVGGELRAIEIRSDRRGNSLLSFAMTAAASFVKQGKKESLPAALASKAYA